MNPLFAIAAAASVATCCGLAVMGASASVKASASAPTGVAARAADAGVRFSVRVAARVLQPSTKGGTSPFYPKLQFQVSEVPGLWRSLGSVPRMHPPQLRRPLPAFVVCFAGRSQLT